MVITHHKCARNINLNRLLFINRWTGFQIRLSGRVSTKEFQQDKFPMLPPNHYKLSINLSSQVADLVEFLICQTPLLPGTLDENYESWKYVRTNSIPCKWNVWKTVPAKKQNKTKEVCKKIFIFARFSLNNCTYHVMAKYWRIQKTNASPLLFHWKRESQVYRAASQK